MGCDWAVDPSNESTLVYKEYKPWMGTHMHDRTATFNGAKTGLRRKIMAEKRKIWEESPEGQEHLKKKQEKKEKQKAINATWKAYRKAKREAKAKEAVDKNVPGVLATVHGVADHVHRIALLQRVQCWLC